MANVNKTVNEKVQEKAKEIEEKKRAEFRAKFSKMSKNELERTLVDYVFAQANTLYSARLFDESTKKKIRVLLLTNAVSALVIIGLLIKVLV